MELGGDFLSMYVSRTDSQIQQYMNGESAPLSFSPSPNKYDRWSFKTDGSSTNHHDIQMNGNVVCHKRNLVECVEHLSQELTSIGLASLYERGSPVYEPVRLVNCTYELLERFQRSGRQREDFENRVHRLESDVTRSKETECRLLRELNQLQQEAVQAQERERQVTVKAKQIAAKLKAEKEEVKRLQSVLQHRDAQHKHEVKKRERENHKLRERIHQMLSDKKSGKIGITISNVLLRPDGSRGTWSGSKQEEELFRSVISNYESRIKELMVENSGLRQCLGDIQIELVSDRLTSSEHPLVNGSQEALLGDDVDGEDNINGHIATSPGGHFQMPFEFLEGTLLRSINDRCRHLKKHIKKLEKQQSGTNVTERGTSPCIKDRRASPCKDDRQKQQNIDKLMNDIKRYKDIVEQQEQFIQDSMSRKSLDGQASFLNESDLIAEKDNLDVQKRLFDDQKVNFQKERNSFTEATVRLHKERAKFEELKAAFLKDQFLQITPFHNKSRPVATIHNNTSLFKQSVKRKLPTTPIYPVVAETPKHAEPLSPISERCDTPDQQKLGPAATPSTVDLYKFLGITDEKKLNRPKSADPSLSHTPSGFLSQRNYSPPWASSGSRRCTSAISRTETPRNKEYQDNDHMTNIKTLLFDQKRKELDLSEDDDDDDDKDDGSH